MDASSATAATSLAYSQVNDAVNEAFFGGRFSLAPVYLDIEGEPENDIAQRLNIRRDHVHRVIAAAAASSLDWSSGNPFSKQLAALDRWNKGGRLSPPPFTALLAGLSLAAEKMRTDENYSAQNYYERLFETLKVKDETSQNSLRQNARSTLKFWEALNLWLAENDFESGRPTARKVNSWEYVSYALSQALIREADREKFGPFFTSYGFAPGERLSIPEMTVSLHYWMGGDGPSAWLKKLWQSEDLRERIATAACSALESWNGDTAAASVGSRRLRLSWAATLQMFPVRRLGLFISGANFPEGQTPKFRLSAGATDAARAAFENCTQGLWLTPTATGEISIMEPISKIALLPLMLASFELESEDKSVRLTKSARPILPMVKSETGPFYREVSRISLLGEHLILCHQKWSTQVRDLLDLNARTGFTEMNNDHAQGIPKDWVLFSGVQMLRVPPGKPDDLQVLTPLAEGAAIELSGGLRLTRNLFHRDAPPEVMAGAPSGPVKLCVFNDADGTQILAQETKGTSCRLELAQCDVGAARDLVAKAEAPGSSTEARISLRSAAIPRPLRKAFTYQAAYCLCHGAPEHFLSAGPVQVESETPSVTGMILSGKLELHDAGRSALSPRFVPDDNDGDEELGAEDASEYLQVQPSEYPETCILRGHHYWICEPFENGHWYRDDRWMTCRDCRNRVLTRNRGVNFGWNRSRSIRTTRPKIAPRRISGLDNNLLFDALCYLGGGPWQRLTGIVGANHDAPWHVQRSAAALFALGHIDIIYDSQSRAPAQWRIAPPALVFTQGGKAFLAGFRSGPMVETLTVLLSNIGGVLARVPQSDAPDALIWDGLTPDSAREALSAFTDPLGRTLAISEQFSARVIAHAPTAGELAGVLKRVSFSSTNEIEAFDTDTGGWKSVSTIQEPGAYRVSWAGRRYVFRDSAGAEWEGDYRLVKLLAAREAGVSLHSYDAIGRAFVAMPGCEPPGLFVRALCACTGTQPQYEAGRIVFPNVGAATAGTLLSKLYH